MTAKRAINEWIDHIPVREKQTEMELFEKQRKDVLGSDALEAFD